MVNTHHKEVLNASTSKGAKPSASDAEHDDNDNGKAIKNVMPYYISQTTDNLKEFDGALDPIASTRWLATVEGAFRTSNYKEKNKVNFASNFLRDSAKMWWEGKFQTLTQTNEKVNEMWKKFNDLIRYYPEYHGNEKLKVERFQRMLRDDIRE
ncbi:zinc finger, CCHC-type, retrotransposon gag domain protein, partial [Tanacetum coccineum]